MTEKALKIMGLNKDYTLEDLEEKYQELCLKYGENKIINDSYELLKSDYENIKSFEKSLNDREPSYKLNEVFNMPLLRALEYRMSGDDEEPYRDIKQEIKDMNTFNEDGSVNLDKAIRYYELVNMQDALDQYQKSYEGYEQSKNKKRK